MKYIDLSLNVYQNRSYRFAEPEKALLDSFYLNSYLKTKPNYKYLNEKIKISAPKGKRSGLDNNRQALSSWKERSD